MKTFGAVSTVSWVSSRHVLQTLTSLFVSLFCRLVAIDEDLVLCELLPQGIESIYASHGGLSNGGRFGFEERVDWFLNDR